MGTIEKKLLLFGLPILSLIMSIVFGWEAWSMGGWMILWVVLESFVYTASIWLGNRQIFLWLYRKWPHIEDTAKRVGSEIPLVIVYTISINFIVGLILQPISASLGLPIDHGNVTKLLGVFVPTAILVSIYESLYFFESWKKDLQRKEALARVHVQSQFEALKKQLDPHFLFNCMNTLASLIDIENEKAQAYLGRLSEVYRYVLDTSERNTVTLEEELSFLDAYVYLNEVRFRENFNVNLSLNKNIYHHRLPALSLQLLVENAIKHNVASPEHPLTIDIYQDGSHLTVQNNKKKKNTLQHSTRLGLQNIIKRYQLLSEEAVQILDEDDTFLVKIPLLDPGVV